MSDDKQPIKRGLGRGLSALIPSAPPPGNQRATSPPIAHDPPAAENDLRQIPLQKIGLNPFQPRTHFDEEELAELTESVREHGILQPIIVRPKGKGWELIAGERRFRAATAAQLATIPAVVRSFTDREALETALIENLQRENLNPVETARAYRRLQQEFSLNQSEVARRVGKPQPTIANALRLLTLPDAVLDSLAAGQITEGHGKAILALDNEEDQTALWNEVVVKRLSVRETERRAAAMKATPKVIPRGITAVALRTDETVALESDLTLLLGAKTRIKPLTEERGVIEIAYYDKEELDGVIDRLLRRETWPG